jgi:hypothetical protein
MDTELQSIPLSKLAPGNTMTHVKKIRGRRRVGTRALLGRTKGRSLMM